MNILGEFHNVKFIDNYDGDSVTVMFKVWRELSGVIKVRLGGIDTPEVGHRAKCDRERELGERAKFEIEQMLMNADSIFCRVYDEKEKFGRVLVDLIADGKDIASELIKADLARPYYGGKRKGWCESSV